MYKLISYSKGVLRVFCSYSDLLEYVYHKENGWYSYIKDGERLAELIDFSGGDIYWDSRDDYSCIKENKPYYVVDSNGKRINASEFKRGYAKLRDKKAAFNKCIREWYDDNFEDSKSRIWHGYGAMDRLYANRNRKCFIPKRGNPIPHTGTGRSWRGYYRSPRYKCRILTNINPDTGGYYDSKYKITNMPVWDDRPRKNEHCWKAQKGCRKQWMKHKKPSEVYRDKREIDPEDLAENVA